MFLSLLSADEAVVIAKAEGTGSYQLSRRVGVSIPLHCSSTGKAILSAMPDEEVRALLARTGMPSWAPNTITVPEVLIAELAETRRRGYAEDREELEPGVRAVAAPVFDHTGQVVGAVSAATLVFRPDMGSIQSRGEMVTATARQISESMGAPVEQIPSAAPGQTAAPRSELAWAEVHPQA